MQFTKLSILIDFVKNMTKRQTQNYPLGQNLKSEKSSGKRYTTWILLRRGLIYEIRTRNEWAK